MSINKVILLGRLGGDPELKYTPTGQAVCNFSVATSEQWTDKNGQKQERTEWSRIVVWGKLGELCNQYLKKGQQTYIEGKLATRSWEDKDGQKKFTTEVIAANVQFLGTPSNIKPAQQAQQAQQSQGQEYTPPSENNFTADDIPF